jgi:hypothetical protein
VGAAGFFWVLVPVFGVEAPLVLAALLEEGLGVDSFVLVVLLEGVLGVDDFPFIVLMALSSLLREVALT